MTALSVAVPAPDFAVRLKALVRDSVHSCESKRAYGRAVDDFLQWFAATRPPGGFSKASVQAYRAKLVESGLAASTINLRMTALRRLAAEAADNGLLAPETATAITRVKGARRQGVRIGNWLSVPQAEALVNEPNTAMRKGKRDRALLAVMLGCGLRREETASLTLEHIQQRDGRWVIVDLVGKGARVRSIPMPSWAKAALDVWITSAELTTGPVFRPVNKGGRVCVARMTAQAVFNTVKAYAGTLGMKSFAPHDLRRSYAKLAHKGHAPLEQIQLSLGHASIQTTERYLGVEQDFTDAPCDHLGLRIKAT
ncbi:MAG TPA: site-specific integrase [Bryobacteraceae bacterium]|nr:site-specific integrase [Bryobacteraceae bacterium]